MRIKSNGIVGRGVRMVSASASAASDAHEHKTTPLRTTDVVDLLKRYLPKGDPEPNIRDLTIYQRAMIHRSCRVESSYERLEFLGDAVLNLATASYLFERYPNSDEGFMTCMRTQLIKGTMLARLCQKHTNLPSFIAIKGKKDLPGNVLEDVFEAFLGAVYRDSGYEVAKKWLVGLWESNVDFSELAAKQDGPKAILNRYCKRNHGFIPTIEILGDGKGVVCGVRVLTPDGTVISTGISPESMKDDSAANKRKKAEEIAVKKALEYYAQY